MADPFEIVPDSSIWKVPSHHEAATRKDPYVRVGTVVKCFFSEDFGENCYIVNVHDSNSVIPVFCRPMRRFGGVYNYEDWTDRGYTTTDQPDQVTDLANKPGDVVIVALLNGQGREGVILGGLTHPGRKTSLSHADGPTYKSEFNGVETSINKDGELTVTFKGQPSNLTKLANVPSGPIPAAQYNADVGSSYYKFDKTGSFEINDNAKSNPQMFKIDKSAGTISVKAGKVSLIMTKGSEDVSLKSKTTNVTSDDSIKMKTKAFEADASSTAKIKSPKVAIGKDGIELLEQIAKALTALGMVKPISPVGPCAPLMGTPEWPDVEKVKGKIKEITGTF